VGRISESPIFKAFLAFHRGGAVHSINSGLSRIHLLIDQLVCSGERRGRHAKAKACCALPPPQRYPGLTRD
jgi:hypothetical protein